MEDTEHSADAFSSVATDGRTSAYDHAAAVRTGEAQAEYGGVAAVQQHGESLDSANARQGGGGRPPQKPGCGHRAKRQGLALPWQENKQKAPEGFVPLRRFLFGLRGYSSPSVGGGRPPAAAPAPLSGGLSKA